MTFETCFIFKLNIEYKVIETLIYVKILLNFYNDKKK